MRKPALKSEMTLETYSSSSGVHFPLLSESFGDEDDAVIGFVLLGSGPSTVCLEASSSTLLGLTGFDTPVGRAHISCDGFRLATNLGESSSEDAMPVLVTACFVSCCFTTNETSRSLLFASGRTTADFCVIAEPLVGFCDSATTVSNSVAFPTAVVAGSEAVIGSLAWFVSASLIVISRDVHVGDP